jgi:hypothetical protein
MQYGLNVRTVRSIMGLVDTKLTVPEWAIEVDTVNMTGKFRAQHKWKSYFSSPPYVVATCMSPTGVPLGNASVHIVSVSVKEIDFSINAYVPGMYVHLHAIGKWRD